jgi:TonB family protein
LFTEAKENPIKLAQARQRQHAEAQAKAYEAARQAWISGTAKVGDRVGQGLSGGTSIEMPGPGGAAYANYGSIVQAVYERAWAPPSELSDESGMVKARVVIRRDGTVASRTVIKPSGNKTLDRSVDRALSIDFVAPFPEGAKDAERTFIINFDLKTRKLFG